MLKALKLDFVGKYQDFGLLAIRIGLGAAFIVHGWPKMMGGTAAWAKLGERFAQAVGLGTWPDALSFMSVPMGFMGAFGELVGGLLLMLGLFMRPATFLLFSTMVVAMLFHISIGDGFGGYSHAMEAAIVFFGLFFAGPGKYSLDQRIG
ncbi:DoxX family protein [Bradymonas sediminis]|uniref:DoxX family protein n=1 Tax=Bradymonas sediminis TaxID=1548548 RepID=A0A2Z4FKU2_9DELT|nr:DoxX family protein [Bradymonas sediminis]AWV89607.1 DoxX family protein [Bradymonas sediminis]TDP76657.1 putative oxidoreductase [Bradymonas sediminis]